jgi:hypothetical protein
MKMFTNTSSKNDEIVRAALEQIPDGITIVNEMAGSFMQIEWLLRLEISMQRANWNI